MVPYQDVHGVDFVPFHKVPWLVALTSNQVHAVHIAFLDKQQSEH